MAEQAGPGPWEGAWEARTAHQLAERARWKAKMRGLRGQGAMCANCEHYRDPPGWRSVNVPARGAWCDLDSGRGSFTIISGGDLCTLWKDPKAAS